MVGATPRRALLAAFSVFLLVILLFFDGHAVSCDTASLPGGMGPNAAGTDIFTVAKIGANPEFCWRMDQR